MSWKKKESDPLAPLRRTSRWKNLAIWIRERQPLCAMCRKVGVAEVHHLEPGEGKFYEPTNLVGLCGECHEKVSGAYKRGGFAMEEVKRILRERMSR